MAKVIDLRIQTTADLKGITSIEQALARVGRASGGEGAAQALKATGTAAAQSEKDILRYANALANVQRASGDAAGVVQTYSTALKSITPNTVEALQATARLTQAQNALAGSAKQASGGMAVLPRTIAGLSHEASAAAKSMLGLGAALGAGKMLFDSFADAFKFKADLDATKASIDAQLTGVRDLGTVYAGAANFAAQFKLTQQETTEGIQASIGVMRSSKAPIEDILSVLARMQVLSPEQSLQEAAIALKALASGDTTSLVTRFEVSRDVANQMKQEIAGGADAVAVMSKFLGDAGIGMDALAAKATGASGAMKDLAIANEQLALAQAEFAQGPGLELLRMRIEVTRDATRLLQGDVTGLNDIFRDLGPISGFIGVMADYNAMVFGAAQSTLEWVGAIDTAIPAQDQQTSAVSFGTAAMDAAMASQMGATQATAEGSVALVENAQRSLDAALEAERLAQFQATLADLGSAVAGGLMTSANAAAVLASQYGIATSEAHALIAAQAALGQAKVNAAALADQRAGERSGGRFRAVAEVEALTKAERAAAASQRRRAEEAKRESAAQLQADMALARAKGNTAGQVNLLRQSQQGLNKSSAEYKNIEAQILGLEKQRAGGGRGGGRAGGGGAGGARASAAEQTATKLQDIERQGGQKIAEINEQTQAKLAAIEAKYAEQRAAAQRALMDEIARTNASTAFAQQLNDFDQFQKDLSDEQRAALESREQAEQEYNTKVAQYQEEARQQAASGDAELAQEILKARTAQAEQEKQIAEEAAKARAAGADAAAVAKEAQEATDAAKRQADTEIAIAQAKAQERAGAEQAEKEAVVAAAEEQRSKVVAAAEDQASKVKGAADSQKSAVISSLRAQADAAKSWASTISSAAREAQSAMDGVTGPPAAGEGGGEGAGDGGGEGGDGATLAGSRGLGRGGQGMAASSSDVITAMQDVVNFLNVLLPTLAAQTKLMREALRYQAALKNTVDIIGQIIALRRTLAQPVPALDAGAIIQIAKDGNTITQVLAQHIDVYAVRNNRLFQHLLAATKASIEILTTIQNLRGQLSAGAMLPIDRALVMKLANEATAVVEIVKSQVITANAAQTKALETWANLVTNSVNVIKGVSDLAEAVAQPQPPIPPGAMARLAALAAETTKIVQGSLIPTSEEIAASLSRYADGVQASISVLKDTAELPESLTKIPPAISPDTIKKLVAIANQVLYFVAKGLIPTSQETVEATERYASGAANAISLIKDTLGLTSNLFTDYKSPTNAQIAMVVNDAKRIVAGVAAAASVYKIEGLEAAKAFGDAGQSILGAFREQLVFVQALNSGDFVPNAKNLAIFEQGMKATIATASRLGAQAAAIPPANITALQNVAAANTAAYESLIKLSAVPFGNIPNLTQNYSASGGGGGSTVINVYGAQGQDVNALANIVMQRINQQVGARR